MKKATGFEECFKRQAWDATKLQRCAENGEVSLDEVNETASSIANSTLRDDLVFQLRNGKAVKMTDRGQRLVHNQAKLLVAAGYMENLSPSGKCLVCGKAFEAGDFAVMEKEDSQNAICLSCATGKIEIREGGNETLVQFV